MKIDREKLRLAMARACVNVADLLVAANIPRPTYNNALQGKGLSPATAGKIAKALGVDVTEILKEEV